MMQTLDIELYTLRQTPFRATTTTELNKRISINLLNTCTLYTVLDWDYLFRSTVDMCSRQTMDTQILLISRSVHVHTNWIYDIEKQWNEHTIWMRERKKANPHVSLFNVHICNANRHGHTLRSSIYNCHSINWNRATQLFARYINVNLIKSCLVWFHSFDVICADCGAMKVPWLFFQIPESILQVSCGNAQFLYGYT